MSKENKENKEEILQCGIVMPISSIDGCDNSHWSDVLGILTDAITNAGFKGVLVSEAEDIGSIHKRIIQNLYENPIVVCDVSGKNPNVMFELGMRLAFDKPTIIVKDNQTPYSFDTSSIEHLEYPRDLRFTSIVEFKKKLTEKITATYKSSQADPNYTTFLKHFGEFKVAKIERKEVTEQEIIVDEIKSLRREIANLNKQPKTSTLREMRANYLKSQATKNLLFCPRIPIVESYPLVDKIALRHNVEVNNVHSEAIGELHVEVTGFPSSIDKFSNELYEIIC